MRYANCGRCMTARNEKHHTRLILSDFYTVGIYSSAMRRPWTVLGTCKISYSELISEFWLTHLLTEDHIVTSKERFIVTYVVEIEITSIKIPGGFPLTCVNDDNNVNYFNQPTKLIVDQITLEYLVTFQCITCHVIQCIYWIGNRSHRIRNENQTLFDLRIEYTKYGYHSKKRLSWL